MPGAGPESPGAAEAASGWPFCGLPSAQGQVGNSTYDPDPGNRVETAAVTRAPGRGTWASQDFLVRGSVQSPEGGACPPTGLCWGQSTVGGWRMGVSVECVS